MDYIFRANLLKYRKAKNLTQEQLTEKLGISFQAVSKWETGMAYPDIKLLPQIASIFQVSIDKSLHPRYQECPT
jgi:transcriptional regulator with XRE-family HTH domain